MKSPTAPTPPPPAPRTIESLAAADEELKKLTGKGFAGGGGAGEGKKLRDIEFRTGGKFSEGALRHLATKSGRVGQLRDFIRKQMTGLDEARRTAGQGRRANIKAGRKFHTPPAGEETLL